MLASQPQGTLYVGVTNDLLRRINEHKRGDVRGFTKRYRLNQLVWFEEHGDIREAISREKRLKRWHRDWKRSLVEETNPHWVDLYPSLLWPQPTNSCHPGQAVRSTAQSRDPLGSATAGPGSAQR
jgi:putative endonuclease